MKSNLRRFIEQSDEESTNETPFEEVVKYKQQEREDNDSEDDIPIAIQP